MGSEDADERGHHPARSLDWLVSVPAIKGSLAREFIPAGTPTGSRASKHIATLQAGVSAAARRLICTGAPLSSRPRAASLTDITVGDVPRAPGQPRPAIERHRHTTRLCSTRCCKSWRIFGAHAPAALRELRTGGQQTPDEMIDRYRLECRPVRDLLVDYLRERQPSLDYNSLRALAYYLGETVLEGPRTPSPRHRQPALARRGRRRLEDNGCITQHKTVTTKSGDKTVVSVPRFSHGQCLTSVRSFYLDLAQWAIEDPARWAQWAVPCPIRQDETGNRKAMRRRKARMDARTRERLPVLPVLIRTVDQRRKAAEDLPASRLADANPEPASPPQTGPWPDHGSPRAPSRPRSGRTTP